MTVAKRHACWPIAYVLGMLDAVDIHDDRRCRGDGAVGGLTVLAIYKDSESMNKARLSRELPTGAGVATIVRDFMHRECVRNLEE